MDSFFETLLSLRIYILNTYYEFSLRLFDILYTFISLILILNYFLNCNHELKFIVSKINKLKINEVII